MAAEDPHTEAVFFQALEKSSLAERSAFLREACAGNDELRQHVLHLLDAHPRMGKFLVGDDSQSFETTDTPISEGPGARIGRYKLLQKIGEGGFGVVFMAEQTEPLRRRVALKIIKPGMDSKAVIARFEAERQALALMDHPQIAKVLDAGTTESGRPYFVMDLVKGTSVTQYCDEHKLTLVERLKLFIPVCHAIQHAHQKGIIHRDLKPTNVLVALYDGQPVPKVIDFGIAKATGAKLTERTLFTEFGAVVGTLEYMSPEQAELNQIDVDTRSDVYALGALLYELLTGRTPFERQQLVTSGFLDALRTIREEEPLVPSTRLSTAGDLPKIAATRGFEAHGLAGAVRGELDWIVMKCLEKDRNRRYDTANSLALDLQRYLHGEAVLAGPPSATYRLRKFVARYKAAMMATAAVVVLLITTMIGLSIAVVVTLRAKHDAQQALDQQQQAAYFQRIALIERELSSGNFERAETLLEQCPQELRAWEWRYLVRQLNGLGPVELRPDSRHRSVVLWCALSPDDRLIAAGHSDGFALVWDTDTRQQVQRLQAGEAGACYRLAFSPDGRWLATEGQSNLDGDSEIKIWDAATWEMKTSWAPPSGVVNGVVYSNDGRLFACVCVEKADGDYAVSIWNPLTKQKLFDLPDHRGLVPEMDVTPDGSRCATVGEDDGLILISDSRSGKTIRTIQGDPETHSLSFGPSGRRIAAGSGIEGQQGSGTLRVWDVETGRAELELTGHGAFSVAFHPTENRLVSGGIDQTIKIWDTDSGQEILTLRGHADWVLDLAFSRDGCRLISAGGSDGVRVWDGGPWEQEDSRPGEVFTLHHDNGVTALAYHPNQPQVATASTDGTVRFWNTQTGRELVQRRAQLKDVSSLSFSPDGQRLAAGATVLETTTGRRLHKLAPNNKNRVLAFSPDGARLAMTDPFGLITIMESSSGDLLHRLDGHRLMLYGVAFNPADNSRLLATAGANGTIRLWNVETGQELDASPLQHQSAVYGVEFSTDGRCLASASWDRSVRLWDTATWKPKLLVRSPTAAATTVALSPDSECRLVAWGDSDSMVNVMDRTSGEIRTLRGHRSMVLDVAFSPDGKFLASASQDGTARIWETPHFP